MVLFFPLSQVTLKDLAQVGGKAARLGEAMHLGCPVLPGVVLSTELYRRFMQQGSLLGEIRSILATMQPTAMTHFHAAEWAIQAAFKVRRMPTEVAEAIGEAWHSLGGLPVAVRSSATVEDSPEQSFVGQHVTCLNISGEEEAVQAVLQCWMSLYSAKALSYAQRFHVDLLNASMAVLMQPMIAVISQGALSTVDPITGNADVFMLEISEGPMQGLHRLDPYTRRPGELYFWSRLRHLGLLLDEHHLAYQSIEWAITDQEQLYFLRVRPVTAVPPYLPEARTQVTVGGGPFEFIRRPRGSARAMPPFSWYHRSRSPQLNAAYFREVHRLFAPYAGREEFYPCGFLYARWRRFALPRPEGFGPLRRMVYHLRCLYVARSFDQPFRRLWQQQRTQLDMLARQDISTLSSRELSEHLQEVAALHEAFWSQYGRLENASKVLADIFCYYHRRWLPDTFDCATLLWNADDQVSLCEEALCKLARREYADEAAREAAFQAALRRYRHLFLRGQPLAEWQDLCAIEEDEAMARRLFDTWAKIEGPSLMEQNRAHDKERRRAEQMALERLGGIRRFIYTNALRLARRYGPLYIDREEPARLCRLLECEAVREVGRRLVAEGLASAPEDACLLGYREIVHWLDGEMQRDELVRLLLQRKDLRRRWWRYSPPDILSDTTQLAPPPLAIADGTEVILRGQAVSPGSARGKARIVRTLGEATNVLPGEILVCPEFLFDFSPLLGLASAVVAERGWLLGHGGVLLREYGLPAVFGVAEATRHIRTGDTLHVDATNGLIMRLPARSEGA